MRDKRILPGSWKELLGLDQIRDYELVDRIRDAYHQNLEEIEFVQEKGGPVKFRIKQVNPEGVGILDREVGSW